MAGFDSNLDTGAGGRKNKKDDDTNTFQKYPSAKEVDQFHRNADTDKRAESIHHTLGRGKDQGSPGDHVHDGGTSQALVSGVIFDENVADPGGKTSILKKVITALTKLGAIDNTSEVTPVQNEKTLSGSVAIEWTTAGRASALVTVNFPPGFFTTTPTVVGTGAYYAAGTSRAVPFIGSVTSAYCQIGGSTLETTSFGVGTRRTVYWIASGK